MLIHCVMGLCALAILCALGRHFVRCLIRIRTTPLAIRDFRILVLLSPIRVRECVCICVCVCDVDVDITFADHLRPPPFADDDDRDIQPFPIYPGQPFPGMPYPDGGRRGGEPEPPMPGYNPDFERDRNPLGMPPRGGNRGMPPPGPFNPGGRRPGGGGFGAPRFM